MGASDYHDRFVVFRDGRIVPASAVVLALELEARAFTLSIDDGSILVVSPPDRLTRDDCARIRREKRHLLHLVAICAHGVDDSHLFTDQPATPATSTSRPA